MSDVFQEVDEELKRQHIDEAFKKYGPMLIAAATVVVLGVGGWLWWGNYQERVQGAAGDDLVAAMGLLVAGEYAEAAQGFEGMSDAPGGYAMLARMQQAAAWRMSGDHGLATIMYDAVADDASVDPVYRDLAAYFSALSMVDGGLSPLTDIESRLAGVVGSDGPFQYHALELVGFAALREGNVDRASEAFNQIINGGDAPDGVVARANEFLTLAEVQSSRSTPAE